MLWPGLGWGILSTLLVIGAFFLASSDLKTTISNPPTVLPTPNLTPILLPIGTNLPIATTTDTPYTELTCPIPGNWVPHLVQPGETLQDLALQAGISIEQLTTSNCLISQSLLPGTVLYLPPPMITPSASNLISATTTECTAPPGWIFYRVQRGDTLTRISGLYGISVWWLKQANCLETDVIITGQYLRVPNVATRTFTPTTSPQPEVTFPSSTPMPPTATFIVVIPTATLTPSFSPVPTESLTPTPTASITPLSTSTETPTSTPTETPTPTETTMVIGGTEWDETFKLPQTSYNKPNHL